MSEEPRIPSGMSLVYLRRGRVAHLAYSVNEHDTVCNVVEQSGSDSYLLGTGTQNEW